MTQAPGFEVVDRCRSCANQRLRVVLDLGQMPLSDALVPTTSSRDDERRYPLTVAFCEQCSLVQILETVDPLLLYGADYPYFSSYSDSLVDHARSNVDAILDRHPLGPDELVVELASNDGYLLQWFKERGVRVLGIDPAPGPASAASQRGIPTICEFFDLELADRLVSDGVRASVIVGNNVLAHVPDQNAFVSAIERLLTDDGIVVMEFPYVKDLIDHGEFDTIYHEHHCYFSVHSVVGLFARHGLHVVSVERLSIHGGSLRIHCSRTPDADPVVEEMLACERDAGLCEIAYYQDFGERVRTIRLQLLQLLDRVASDGSRVAGYGAAAKAAILLNYCGIGRDRLEYIVDRNTHKHGFEMPGQQIPIVGPDHLLTNPPDYLLVLAWNFRDEIMRQQSEFAQRGGKFIIPIPEPVVI